ncbi:hypothetical protein K7432_006735 [Basidiobolus ranarum]|uniref:Carrier domain-containing protein n=1 Tax=Basidiobolus ranarum TaxID=34480 RepID=A0ABR2WUF1_9FUNG
MQQESIKECAVIARDDPSGEKQLVAYIVADSDSTSGTDSQREDLFSATSRLREQLRTVLPKFMVPSFFVFLDSLPLMPNGKINRQGLPAPDYQQSLNTIEFESPKTDIELSIAKIFAEVLGLEKISIHDNFFDLGGHSLSATKVISRIRVQQNLQVPLRLLFDAPTVALLSEGVSFISKNSSGVPQSVSGLKRLTSRDKLPLSFAQERLWFMDALIPNSSLHNVSFALKLEGDLNLAALSQAILDVVTRHEILRTKFVLMGNEPVQVIEPARKFTTSLVEYIEIHDDQALVQSVVTDEFRKPFNLATGPLIRVKLIRTKPDEHVLSIAIHHIVSDGWSITILQRELSALYESYSRGEPSTLPEPVIQYADFAVWQRKWLQGETLDCQMNYWKDQLNGVSSLTLPIDFVRPPILTYHAKSQQLELSSSFTNRLKELCSIECSTLYMVLLTAFEILLQKCTGNDDIAIGSPIANRNHKEIEGLIGFFVNIQVIRVQVDHQLTFSELLARVKEVTLGAYSHQDVPFEQIVAELQPERDLSRNPLVQVMFALQDATVDDFKFGDIDVKPVSTGEIATRFDLEVHFWKHDDGLKAEFIYSTDLFSSDTIGRMISGLEKVLHAAVENPNQPIGTLQLLDPAEREHLLVTMNMTATDYPRDKSIVDIFEQQVQRTPDAISVENTDEKLTYLELHQMSNRLASHLVSLGVETESSVGICMERSPLMIVAMLAVLKAGGAYVPLDSQYPSDRLQFMTTDTKAVVVICQKSTALAVPAGTHNVLCLDEQISDIMKLSEEYASLRPTSTNLAYTIYTSGSTGVPKGVLVEHRSVIRLVKNTEYINIQNEDKIAHIASTSFDAATFEVWGALLNGATIVCMSQPDVIDLTVLSRNMTKQAVTIIFLTTALFNRVVEDAPSVFSPVKHVLFGGEAVDHRSVQRFLDLSNRPRLLHVYGPTENTTFSTWYEVHQISNNVPIGKSLCNGRIYVLDPQFNPVPIGFVGELCLAGDGLARGYLNRPELTSERFKTNPNIECNEETIYCTGDLVRYNSDGYLEFVGRMDHQVKIRGYRIELGEVENIILQQDSIKECAVIARDDPSGEKQLVAYVVVDSDSTSGMDIQQVDEWGAVFDQHVYDELDEDLAEPSFNITGWKCTLTGEDIPADEMREWLRDTIAGIRKLGGNDILEIGCGTGMLLFEIAPHCAHYVGTDVSSAALSYVNKYLGMYSLREKVTLEKRSGDQLDDMEEGSFDTVICNSVAQYFPNIDYLKAVVVRAVKLLRPGGHIFLGDIRSLVLLKHFHSAMELHKAHNELTAPELEQRISDRMMSEKELLVDPAFFFALKEEIPEISHVDILTKTGCSINELTQYRYQVIIKVGTCDDSEIVDEWVDYQATGLTLNAIKSKLLQGETDRYAIENIPNSRLTHEVALVKLLKSDHKQELNVANIRQLLVEGNFADVSVEELYSVSKDCGYDINISWNCHVNDGCFDVVFSRNKPGQVTKYRFKEPSYSLWNWKSYGNNPMNEAVNQRLSPYLRDSLRTVLPKFMVPSAIVILDSLPLMPNGKINRRALPAPHSRIEENKNFLSARTALELTLSDIFAEVLGLERVGILENFFDLGGHSLTATKVMSRIRVVLNREVPLKLLFEAPTVASLSEKLESNMNIPTETNSTPQLRKLTNRENLPLSFAQERLWFLNELIPNSPFYNMPVLLNFMGQLNVDALKKSILDIVKRHESLRTTFTLSGNEPVQVINSAANVSLSFIEYSDVTHEPELVKSIITQESGKPFNMAEGPLIRVNLVRVKPEVHVLIIVLHHIISDGWSITVLQKELAALYESNSLGLPSPLPDLTIQYADFAVWQREWLQGETLNTQLKYWKEQLKDISPLILPTDMVRPAISSHRGHLHRIYIPESLTQKLRELSQQHTTTLFMTLFAAFGVLLNKYTEQEDIVIGSPIASRNVKEIEALIGFFVNTLVLRLQINSGSTFSEILNQAKVTTLDASTYQDLPFEKIVAELQPQRDLSLNPLVQVIFALHELSITDFDIKDLNIDAYEDHQTTSRLDLEVHMYPQENGLRADIIYCTDLFVSSTIEQMFEGFVRILECIVIDPQQNIENISMLDETKRQHHLCDRNLTATEYPRNKSIVDLFEDQARCQPDAVAVVHGDEKLTYLQLHKLSSQLAVHLINLGVELESSVAVCMERSPLMLVALLAILKAGGAYVPLDSQYPSERLRFMLNDTNASVVICQKSTVGVLPQGNQKFVCLDTEIHNLMSQPELPITVRPSANNLAYIIYTSGSTGTPKGVLVEHRAVVRLVRNTEYVDIGNEDFIAHIANTSFDAVTFEVWGALLNGATVVCISHCDVIDLNIFSKILEKHSITLMFLTTALFNRIMEDSPEVVKHLKQLIVGGDVLDRRSVSKFLSIPDCPRLLNGYGPTENTTFSTWYEVKEVTNTIPIGKPLSNSKAYVLDQQLGPVPDGFVGELCVAGDGLARGYLNRPELTSQKFIVNPNPECDGEIIYRTGDLARYRSDGNIEFIGRRDHQVKIRGFRIETDEIKNILLEHEGIKECVVVVNSEADVKRIIAYVTKSEVEVIVTERSLLVYLANLLPNYMLPYAILMVDNIPLSPNGKVDTRSLSTLASLSAPEEETYVEPQTPLEIGIANIMADVLSLERVGVNDNFFDLGGYSLLSIQLISKIRKHLGVVISLQILFEAPTVFMLAKHASLQAHGTDNEAIDSPVVLLRDGGDRTPIVLVHAIGGGISCYQPLLSCLNYDGPIYGIYASDFLGLMHRKSFSSVEDMAQYYVESLMELSRRRRFIIGGWSYGGNIAFAIAVALQKLAVDVPSVVFFDSYPLFGAECYERYSMPLTRMIVKLMNQMHESTEYLDQEFHIVRDLFGLSSNISRDDEVTLELLTSALNRISHMRQYQPDMYSGVVYQIRSLQDKLDYFEDTSSLQEKWATLVEGKYISKSVEGSHASMMQAPYVENTASELEMFIGSLSLQ